MIKMLDLSLPEDIRKEYEIYLVVYGKMYTVEEVQAMDDTMLRNNYYLALANAMRYK